MDWQNWVVGGIFLWAVFTVVKVFWPKKQAGCSSGDCACGPEEIKPKKKISLKIFGYE